MRTEQVINLLTEALRDYPERELKGILQKIVKDYEQEAKNNE